MVGPFYVLHTQIPMESLKSIFKPTKEKLTFLKTTVENINSLEDLDDKTNLHGSIPRLIQIAAANLDPIGRREVKNEIHLEDKHIQVFEQQLRIKTSRFEDGPTSFPCHKIAEEYVINYASGLKRYALADTLWILFQKW